MKYSCDRVSLNQCNMTSKDISVWFSWATMWNGSCIQLFILLQCLCSVTHTKDDLLWNNMHRQQKEVRWDSPCTVYLSWNPEVICPSRSLKMACQWELHIKVGSTASFALHKPGRVRHVSVMFPCVSGFPWVPSPIEFATKRVFRSENEFGPLRFLPSFVHQYSNSANLQIP